MTASPYAWQTLENGLRAWVVGATELDETSGEKVLWQWPNAPQALRPFAVLSVLSAPVLQAQHESRMVPQIMVDRVSVTGAGAVVVTIYGIDPDDAESYAGRSYTAGPGADAAAVRDELLAEIAAETGVTPSTSTGTTLLLTGTAGRRRFHTVVTSGPATRTTITEAALETVYAPAEMTIRVQVETAIATPDGHARNLIGRVSASLGDRALRRALRTAGLFFRRMAPPVDLTGVIGDRAVSRVAQDFYFAVNSAHDLQVPWTRTAAVTGTLSTI